jgi:hypothetical protein
MPRQLFVGYQDDAEQSDAVTLGVLRCTLERSQPTTGVEELFPGVFLVALVQVHATLLNMICRLPVHIFAIVPKPSSSVMIRFSAPRMSSFIAGA